MFQVIASGAYSGVPESQDIVETSCLDSWTGVSVKVPMGGLTPYPDTTGAQPGYAPDVIISPIALLTLGSGDATKSNIDIRGEYDLAHQQLGVASIDAGGGQADGQYGQGMMNSGRRHLQCSKVRSLDFLLLR